MGQPGLIVVVAGFLITLVAAGLKNRRLGVFGFLIALGGAWCIDPSLLSG